jgi:hypothetical protein
MLSILSMPTLFFIFLLFQKSIPVSTILTESPGSITLWVSHLEYILSDVLVEEKRNEKLSTVGWILCLQICVADYGYVPRNNLTLVETGFIAHHPHL